MVVRGDQLPGLAGAEIDRLRLIALGADGQARPIPYQIDQRDQAGYYVLPHPLTTGKRSYLSRTWAANDADGNTLDANDELAFRLADAGEKAGSVAAFPGAAKLTEIQLADRQGRRGWVYLAAYASDPPPPAARGEVRYDSSVDAVTSDCYVARFRPGRADITLSGLQLREGDGAEILDRMKVRLTIDPIIGPREEYTEDDYASALAGYAAGPVRMIRIAEHNLHLGPLLDARLQVVSTFSRELMTLSARLYVPVTAGSLVRQIFLRVGPDLTNAATGVQFYPSCRSPVTVDGRMDSAERNLVTNEPTWLAWSGRGATMFFFGRAVPPARLPTKLFYLDDARANVGPDREPGAWGQGAYEIDLLSLKKGFANFFYSIALFPGSYRPGLEDTARELVSPPVQASAREL